MSMETKHPHPHDADVDVSAGYEKRDVNVSALLQFGFWMAVVLFITFVGMRWTFNYFAKTQPLGPPAAPFVNQRVLPPNPRLQVTPHADLEQYCAGQQAKVNTYSWVDRRLGVVRVPVDRAMDLALERGLPSRSGGGSPNPAIVTPPPAVVAGGADLQGPCGYLAPEEKATSEK
jgi:uncharacterized iron-regulated membrane protein